MHAGIDRSCERELNDQRGFPRARYALRSIVDPVMRPRVCVPFTVARLASFLTALSNEVVQDDDGQSLNTTEVGVVGNK